MLTHHDRTVANAAEVFESCKNMPVMVWGMKEESLPFSQMKALYTYMKKLGKTTALEVVAYSEKESLAGRKWRSSAVATFLWERCSPIP